MNPSDIVLRRSLAASSLDSSEWNAVQADLRNRAFFSARVEDARFLALARAKAAGIAGGTLSASEARRDLRAMLYESGYLPEPGSEGGLRDLASRRRLDLIVSTNAGQARGYARWLEGSSEGALAAFPAQELVRLRERRLKRDWSARWRAAGGRTPGGIMAALKTDPVWTRISRFGNPWPPFDYGSGMGLRDIGRDEAISIGLMRSGDPPPAPPARRSMNDGLFADVPFAGEDDAIWRALRSDFGDQISRDGDKIVWRGGMIRDAFHGSGKTLDLGGPSGTLIGMMSARDRRAFDGKPLAVDNSAILKRDYPSAPAITDSDLELLPAVWRAPDRVRPGASASEWLLEMETFDGGILIMEVSTLGRQSKIISLIKHKK